LLADDHARFLAVAEHLLATEFEIVKTVGDGKALIVEAAGLGPDVIVLDISMPELNGIDAARQLKAAGSKAKFVFLTVYDDPEHVRGALATGAQGYVVKSRLALDLVPAVREALASRSFVSPTIALN
jgi:DNA-binding NarL/FixJ family response regulator